MSVNNFPSNKTQVITAKYPERGFVAYENRGSRPYVSQSAVENLVQWSNEGQAVGTVNAGQALTFTANLVPKNQFTNMSNMAICYLTVHCGTPVSAANQIYPVMGTANPTHFIQYSGFDYLRSNAALTDSYFSHYLANVGTVSYTLYYYAKWQFIQNNSGASNDE